MSGQHGGKVDIKVTVGQVTSDIKSLSTQIENLNRLAAPATDNIKALKGALEEIKATYSTFKGVKIDGAAIAKALPNFDANFENKLKNLKGISEKFKVLGDALKGITDAGVSAEKISKSFFNLKISLAAIKDLSNELNEATVSVQIKGTKGTVNYPDNVFSSFNRMLKTINDSVDEEQFAKFNKFASSLKSFVISLKDMIGIAKSFTHGFKQLDAFFSQLGDPKLNEKNSNVSRIQQIVGAVSEYVDALAPKVQRGVSFKENESGGLELQTIINSRVAGINDVSDTIKKLIPILNDLAGAKITEATKALNSAKEKIFEFITALSNIGQRSTTGGEQIRDKKTGQFTSNKTPIKEVLSAKVQGTRDVLDLISTLSKDISGMTGKKIETGIANIETAKNKIFEFVQKISSLLTGESSESEGGLQLKFTSKPTTLGALHLKNVESTLKVNLDSVKDVLGLINTLSTYLVQMAGRGVSTGIRNIDNAKIKIAEFIDKLSSLGERSTKGGVTRNEKGQFSSNSEVKEVLNKKVQATQDILKTIDMLSASLQNMAADGITNGISAVDSAKIKISEFIEKLGELGERSTKGGITRNEKGQFTSNSPVKEILNKQIQGVHDVLGTISLLSTDLKGLSGKQIEDSIRVIDSAKTKIAEFIEKLSSLGTRPEGHNVTETTLHKDGSITEKSYFKQGLNANVVAVQDILSTIGLLSTNLAKLASGEEIRNGLTNIDTARTKINTFIESLGSLGKRKQKTVTNENGKNENVEELNDKLKGVHAVLDVIKILTGEITTLSKDTANALAALELAKPALIQFIKDMSDFAGLHDKTTYNKETGTFETSEVLSDRLQGFSALVNSIQPFTSVLSKLNVPDDFKGKIEKVGNAIRELITSFTPVKPEEGLTLAYGADNMNVISSALNSYGNALGKISLPKTALGDTGTIKATAQNIYDLLDAFRTMDVQVGLDNMTVVSNVLAKYAGVLKSMSKIGVIDFSQVQKAFTEFVQALNTLVSSDALKKLDTGDTDRFGAIGRALKGVSSFLNSIIKGGDFSGFTSNIQNAIPAITDFINQMARLSTLSSFPDFERVAKAVGSFNGRLHDVNNTIEHTSRGMLKLKSIMRQVYTAFVGGAVVYSIVRGIKDAIKSMYDLEYAMARVNTIARVSSSTLTEMTHKVQEMSAKYGVESAKVSKALYDINSATIKGAASMKILEQSMALAVAGFTDVEKVADLIAKATNAYEYSANEAAKISDILFVTVERGINPMEELSEYFGRLFTVSANAGVSLEETAAGLATLTARGYQTNVASTALNSAILKLSTGTKELNKLFKDYGFASSASALRTMGLAGALQVLNKATGGATEKLHDLGFNYRDIRAATTLASGAISEYNKTLTMMNDKNYTANKTSEALAKVQDTVKYKFDQLKQTYVVFVQSISEYLNKNELIKQLLTTLTEGIENVTKAMRGMTLSFSDQFKAGIATLIPKLVIAFSLLNKTPVNKIFNGILGGVALSKAGFNSMKDSIAATAQKMRGASDELLIMSDASSSAKISVEGTTRSLQTGFASAKASITSTTAEINTLVSAINKVPVAMADVNAAMKSLNFTPAAMYNRNNLMVNPLDSGVLKNLNTSLVSAGQIPTVNGFTVNPSGYNPSISSPAKAVKVDLSQGTLDNMKRELIGTLPKATPEVRGFRTADLSDAYYSKVISRGLEAGAIGEKFDAHGIAKGNIESQISSLSRLLTKGIDPNRDFYTAPFTFGKENRALGAGMGTISNGAYKEGLATLVSNYGKKLEEGIGTVFINNEVAKSFIPILRKNFPDVRFENIADQQRVLQEMANVANIRAQATGMSTKPFGGLQVDPAYYYGHSGLGAFSERGVAAGFGTTFVTKNPNAPNWSPFSASIQATTKDIGKLDVNTSNLLNTLNYSLNKITTKFNDFNSGVNNLAKNLDVVKNVSNDVSVSLNSTFKANKGVFAPLAYSQVTPNIKPFSGTDILKNEWQSTNLSVAPNGTSGGGVITVNALKKGVDAIEEAGQKAGEEVVKFSDKLKVFGKTAGGAVSKFATMYVQMAAINGLVGLLGDVTTLKNSELSFKEILDSMFNLRSALAFLPTAAGKFVDILTFGLTNLGERISQELNPADYVDEEAVRKSRGYVGSKEEASRKELAAFRSTVASLIKPFKELKENATTLGINESDIIEKYAEINKQIDAEAKKRGISQEDLNLAHKAVDKVRDSLQDYNDVLNSLMPNMQALNDVFESARKAIESNSEKHAGEMEKTIGKILDVEEAIDTMVKGTNLTAEQIKSGVSSVSNFEVLEEMIREPFVELSKAIVEKIMPDVESAFVDVSEASRREKLQKEYSNVIRKNVLLSHNISREFSDMFGEFGKFDDVIKKITEDSDFRGRVISLNSQFGGEDFTDAIESYFKEIPSASELLQKPFDNIIESLSGTLSEDKLQILKSKKEALITEWANLKSEYKTNAEFITNMFADAVSDPEIRKALDNLANNYVEVVKNTDKFRKSLVKLGTEIQQLEAQNISVKDIIGNAFGLTSVAELKDSLKFALYDPKVLDKMKLEGADVNGAVDNYAMIVADGLKKNLSLDNILDSLDEALSKDKAFENMDASERRKKGKLFFDRVKGMVEFTTETANSMAELDYTKFMNKMRFGGDISAFQQYKQIDSKRISSLMEREVIDGLKFADAFAEFNQNVQDSDYTTALTKFSTEHKGGLEIFLNMVKQLEGIFNGSASSLQTEYKNFNKKAESFVEKYRDSLLTPIQKFEKVDDELNMQLKMLEMQAEQGNVSPELLNNTLENMEELQKLNEEVMNMKVPSSITASEAVKTGSKEAFDLVATNIFRDMYKVNVQQSNYQKDMVNKLEQLVKKSDSSLQIIGYGG